jgi:TPR repeat protein
MDGSVYAASGDWAAAVQCWEHAAALGHVPSYAALAEVYYEGRVGVARWFERAAELGAKGAGAGCADCKVCG